MKNVESPFEHTSGDLALLSTLRNKKSLQKEDDEKNAEIAKLILSTQIEEYKSLRSEYSQHMAYQHQILTLTFALAGAVLAASPSIISSKDPGVCWIYLLASVVFVAISWTQLRYLEANVAIRNYIIVALGPRIQTNLSQIYTIQGNSEQLVMGTEPIFGWESEGINFTYRSEWWMLPIMGARLFLSLLAAMTSVIAFIFLSTSRGWYWPVAELSVFLISAIIIFSVIITFVVLRDVREYPGKEWIERLMEPERKSK